VACSFKFSQTVKDIGGTELNISRVIQLGITRGCSNRIWGNVDCPNTTAGRSDVKRKASIERDTIQRAGMSIMLCAHVTLALIEESACFLTSEWRNQKPDAVLTYFELRRGFAVQHACQKIQTFKRAHASVVALNDGAGIELVDQKACEQLFEAFRALRKILHDKHI